MGLCASCLAGGSGQGATEVSAAREKHREDASKRRNAQHLAQNLMEEEFDVDVSEVYETSDTVLGTGISGTVRVVVHRKTGQKFALKTIHLKQIKDAKKLEQLQSEVAIMAELDHPNIIRLYECYQSPDHIYMVMQLCTGGELLDRLNSLEGHHYTEERAASLIKTMCGAVEYLHNHNIVHRDLKLENFLFESEAEDSPLKLIDFGLSRHYVSGEEMHLPVGTPFYVAPEVLRGAYTDRCDMWSIGVMAYMLVSGTPPFAAPTQGEILARVRSGQYSFPERTFGMVSEHAKDFIRKLLVKNPAKRMTAKEALAHPWLHDFDRKSKPVKLAVVKRLTSFAKLSAFKKIAHEVIAFSLPPDQIGDLRDEFSKFDPDQTGEVSLDTMRSVLEASQNLSSDACERIFESLDMDHTETISWIEFLAATMKRSLLDQSHLKAAFSRMDRDHDGYIDATDLKSLVGIDMEEGEIDEMFNRMNLKAPGRIDSGEFIAYMQEDVPGTPTRARKKGFDWRELLHLGHTQSTQQAFRDGRERPASMSQAVLKSVIAESLDMLSASGSNSEEPERRASTNSHQVRQASQALISELREHSARFDESKI